MLLTGATIISCLSCNGVYAYAQEDSLSELTTRNIALSQTNKDLKEENKRLNNMLSQYQILIRSLRDENESLKNSIEEVSDEGEVREYIGEYTLTYYCKESDCRICGGGGKTASGTQVTPYRSVAVDPKVIPLGTKLYIEGVGYRIAEDTGSAVKGNKIDINVTTHSEALQLGKKHGVKVWIVEE